VSFTILHASPPCFISSASLLQKIPPTFAKKPIITEAAFKKALSNLIMASLFMDFFL
jgi:hypothetical protein